MVLRLVDNGPEVTTEISRTISIHMSSVILIKVMYYNAVPTSKRTQSVCTIKTNHLNILGKSVISARILQNT